MILVLATVNRAINPMKYLMTGQDGQQYGPADVDTLNQWIQERRLGPFTMLTPEEGGPQVVAAQAPGLQFGVLAAIQTATLPPSMEPQLAPPGTFYSPMQPLTATAFGPAGAAASGVPFTAYPRSYGNDSVLPEEVRRKFNWGACLLSWIWGVGHGKYWTLATLVVGAMLKTYGFGLAMLLVNVWFGVKGNEWAWSSGRFNTVDELEAHEMKWAKWGAIIGAVCFSLLMMALIFPLVFRRH